MNEVQNSNLKGLQSLSLYNIAFTVTDLEKSISWYADILNFILINKQDFEIPTGKAEVAMLEGAGIKLELLKFPNAKRIEELFAPAPMHLIPIGNKAIVFQVDDIKTTSTELEAKGAKFVWREQYIAADKMLCTMIEDIDGNKINIVQKDTTI
ncbi:VOC family protein [Flavobacterium psychroterrae]|uniref:VOC family protein n=1 Tax=Flavobacterium psychroterrae TaxID=2133767 RepID=A0ABS5PIZ4_9FLAO|nr:VOC family protein [Flavobacterium psychroterrae]MBS7234101.1 VOC family protein [Flavobacterium psychroterrae]